jgi:ADP-heptose:LPS heptosyltransferase
VTPDDQGLEYYIPENATIHANDLPTVMHSPFIAFAIGAAHEGKRMSENKLLEVCRSIKQPLVLLGGPEDKELGDRLAKECGSSVFNACGAWTIHQSADAIRRAEIVIAGDTGMMHIASALGKKIISLWGCTVPGLGMSAYKPHPKSIIIEPKQRSRFRFHSRPCSKLGNRCKYGMNNRCIDQIEINQINAAIEKLWAPQTTP